MCAFRVRLDWAETLALGSLIVLPAAVAAAFGAGWYMAVTPGATFLFALAALYVVFGYHIAGGGETRVAPAYPAAERVAFRVVEVHGACPLGRRTGDVVRVDGSGAVAPSLCEPAEGVLRIAARSRDGMRGERWCCPIADHRLVFERQPLFVVRRGTESSPPVGCTGAAA